MAIDTGGDAAPPISVENSDPESRLRMIRAAVA
jgi:hypothetical protein